MNKEIMPNPQFFGPKFPGLVAGALGLCLTGFLFSSIDSPSLSLIIFLIVFAVICTLFTCVHILTEKFISGKVARIFVAAVCLLLGCLLAFSAVFALSTIFNHDIVLIFGTVYMVIGFSALGIHETGRHGPVIKTRHKFAFSLFITVAVLEILLRIFAVSFFGESRREAVKSRRSLMFFADREDEKTADEASRKLENLNRPVRISEPDIGFILDPECFGDYRECYNPKRHSGKAPEGVIRIACLGGSTTFFGYPRYLEAAMKKNAPGLRFEIIDAAVPGYAARHSYLNLKKRVSGSRPDIVIIYHGINELLHLLNPDIDENYRGRKRPDGIEHASTPVIRLVRKLAVVRFINVFAARISGISDDYSGRVPGLDASKRNIRRSHMRILLDYIRGIGAKPVLCSFALAYGGEYTPEIQQKINVQLQRYACGGSAADAAGAIEELNSDLRELARQMDVPFADVAGEFPRTVDYFIDSCHHSSKGMKLLAGLIADFIHGSGILDSGNAGEVKTGPAKK
ncbi:MAG: GDSL-type esterase/lipase family protein [Planctomycetota bacterium]|jgi:hypothetical protein